MTSISCSSQRLNQKIFCEEIKECMKLSQCLNGLKFIDGVNEELVRDGAGCAHINLVSGVGNRRLGELDGVFQIKVHTRIGDLFNLQDIIFNSPDKEKVIPAHTKVFLEVASSNGNTIVINKPGQAHSYVEKKLEFNKKILDSLTDISQSLFHPAEDQAVWLLVFNGADCVRVNDVVQAFQQKNPNMKCFTAWVDKVSVGKASAGFRRLVKLVRGLLRRGVPEDILGEEIEDEIAMNVAKSDIDINTL